VIYVRQQEEDSGNRRQVVKSPKVIDIVNRSVALGFTFKIPSRMEEF
jgi:hypothetical protein